MTSISSDGQSTHKSHQVVLKDGKKYYKDELDDPKKSSDSNSIWNAKPKSTSNEPKIISSSDSDDDTLGESCYNAMYQASNHKKTEDSSNDNNDDTDKKLTVSPAPKDTDTKSKTSFYDNIKKNLDEYKAEQRRSSGADGKLKIKPAADEETTDEKADSTTSTKGELSNSEKKELLSIANSNVNRKRILMDIEAGVANGESAQTIKNKIASKYNLDIADESEEDTPAANIDWNVGKFNEGFESDNKVLSTLQAMASTEEGSDAIGSAISQSMIDGKVNVKLGDKTYSYTSKEIKEAQVQNLSKGDDDATVIEMAYKDYLKDHASQTDILLDKDFLADDDGKTLVKLLTGKTAETLENETTDGKSNTYLINQFLNNKASDSDKYIGTVSFDNVDSSSNVTEDRTYSIDKVENGNVVLTDSLDTGKQVTMSTQEFLKNKKTLNIFS